MQSLMVCKKENRIETIQNIIDDRNIKILVEANEYNHRIIVNVCKSKFLIIKV